MAQTKNSKQTREQLEALLAAEQAQRQRLEQELASMRGTADEQMAHLASFLVEAINDPDKDIQFRNPTIESLPDAATHTRCWLHDPDCIEIAQAGNFGERIQACSDCDTFRNIAPDSFTQVGELINAVLHQLRRKQKQFMETQQQLLQSEKLAGLGELAAGLAHEINNPTGIILSRLDCMELDSDQLSEDVREDLRVIRRHAERLRRITRSLTSFARRHKVEKKVVVLQDLVHDILEIIDRTLENSNVERSVQMPEDPMIVFADATMIQQVFMNIILNARDAMPGGGRLEIRGSSHKGENVIEVQDDGIGMEREVRERIFDPFFTTKDSRGTGLGLSVSYGIIEDHGGRIEVESEPGEGALFRVVIPKYDGSAEEPSR